MKIYIDSEFHCHTTNPDGVFKEVETSFFDGKCDAFVEGYRYIPDGESWTREDGKVFRGKMIAPLIDINILEEIQLKSEYEDMRQALAILEVEVNG